MAESRVTVIYDLKDPAEKLGTLLSRISGLGTDLEVETMTWDLEKLTEPIASNPNLVILFQFDEKSNLNELAQVIRMNHADCAILAATEVRATYDKKQFVKNGASDVFLLPLETETLMDQIRNTLGSLGSIASYKRVQLVDVAAGDNLPFDTMLYLPANKRYVKIANQGQSLDQEKLNKFSKHHVKTVHIPASQTQNFYNYAAERLKKIQNGEGMSATERQEKLTESIRSIVSEIFRGTVGDSSFEHGNQMLADCQGIVTSYVKNTPAKAAFERIMSTVGHDSGVFDHASSVSTYATLFGLAWGIKNPEEVGVAALLHDIGLVEVPPDVAEKPDDQLSDAERVMKAKHPEASVKLIKAKRMAISETASKAIMQHHERYNGSGYPKGLSGGSICKEAQVLGFADYFDYLTTARAGQRRMGPQQIREHLAELASRSITTQIFDPSLLKAILALFPEVETKDTSNKAA